MDGHSAHELDKVLTAIILVSVRAQNNSGAAEATAPVCNRAIPIAYINHGAVLYNNDAKGDSLLANPSKLKIRHVFKYL